MPGHRLLSFEAAGRALCEEATQLSPTIRALEWSLQHLARRHVSRAS